MSYMANKSMQATKRTLKLKASKKNDVEQEKNEREKKRTRNVHCLSGEKGEHLEL